MSKGSGPNRKEMLLKKCFIWKEKDIYSTIVKTVYRNSSIEQHILENLQIDESEIETFYADYKHEFDTLEWSNICIFEHHFSRSSFYSYSDSYENIVQQRASFQDILQETRCIQNALLTTFWKEFEERKAAQQIMQWQILDTNGTFMTFYKPIFLTVCRKMLE